ncbi:FGGY family carbohydrate kinase [Leucobacter rhizosphaerae]|uniref:FGGY family carbohydrate kinase n=1 Tax=Leucobacter rhizosphaerae TaxID=2932245 RepID=A0ABY4FT95_9MICO|nr:FGGY family carbohydrate kinase [Leucobacter rhizosphaerae]UOQ59487.1 FGGY family carbohydrate kinase [Leucobacter rhizosphaerae]
MTVIAGLDFGTSSVKLVVAFPDGRRVRAQAAYATRFGPAGEIEQDPEEWWRAAETVLADSGVADRIDAIGVTGQMQDLVPVSSAGALRPAMLYSDTRAEAAHRQLHAAVPDWELRTGNIQDVTSVASKIRWMSEHEPDLLASADTLLLGAPGYIAWRAGGRAVCDVLTASTTGLLDVHAQGWFEGVVQATGARLDQMPELVGSVSGDDRVGAVSARAAAELGITPGVPIVMVTGDAGSTTDGLVGSSPGDAYLYLGTTGWVAGVSDEPASGPSVFHSLVMPGWRRRLQIGAVQSAGAAADWGRRTFFPGLDFDEVERLIESRVDVVAHRPLCLPGLSGERTPVRDSAFRGAFVGVQEQTDSVDMYLGILTGVAMGLRHAAGEMGILQDRLPLVGGAASSPAWRRILANVCGSTVVTGEAEDPGCHAALRAVARAGDAGPVPAPLFSAAGALTETRPTSAQADYAEQLSTHRELYAALAPTFHRLSAHEAPTVDHTTSVTESAPHRKGQQ